MLFRAYNHVCKRFFSFYLNIWICSKVANYANWRHFFYCFIDFLKFVMCKIIDKHLHFDQFHNVSVVIFDYFQALLINISWGYTNIIWRIFENTRFHSSALQSLEACTNECVNIFIQSNLLNDSLAFIFVQLYLFWSRLKQFEHLISLQSYLE